MDTKAEETLTPLAVLRNFFDAFNRVDFKGIANCFGDHLAAVHVCDERNGDLINTAPIPGLAAAERNYGLAKNGRRYNVIQCHEVAGQPGTTTEGQVFAEFQMLYKGVVQTAQANIYTVKNGKIVAKCAYTFKPNHPVYNLMLPTFEDWGQGLTPPLEAEGTRVDALHLPTIDEKEEDGHLRPLHVARNFFDAFNRRDKEGIERCFAKDMHAIHVDSEEIEKGINEAPNPGLAAAERNWKLAEAGYTYNVIRCYEIGKGRVVTEFQMLKDAKPVTAQWAIYTVKKSQFCHKIMYIHKVNHVVYNKPLPAFSDWAGLPPPAPAHNLPKKRIVCVNGWGASTTENWMETVLPILQARGAILSRYPGTPGKDSIADSVRQLTELVGQCDENTYFLGQSVGNQIIIRYLASLPAETKVGGFFGVAAWLKLQAKTTEPREAWVDEFMATHAEALAPWLDMSTINFARFQEVCGNAKLLVSEDDPFNIDDRGAENAALLETNLKATVEVVTGSQHFLGKELSVGDRRMLLRFFAVSLC